MVSNSEETPKEKRKKSSAAQKAIGQTKLRSDALVEKQRIEEFIREQGNNLKLLAIQNLRLYNASTMRRKKKSMLNPDLVAQYGKDLIAEICRGADGIGGTKAGAIAEHFENFSDFVKAGKNEFRTLVSRSGKSILSSEQIGRICELKSNFDSINDIPGAWIYHLARKFLANQIELLGRLKFDDLDINPLIAKALQLKSAEDIIRFNLYQSVTRSAVTSWGTTVEEMLKYSGCDLDPITVGSKGRRPDLKKVKEGITHYFQIKSGPNTMNVDMVESLNRVIEEIETKRIKVHLGMTYGKRDRISQQILGNLKNANERTKIGRELWDFISEVKNYHKRVIEILDLATKEELRSSFTRLIEEKIHTFIQVWEGKFPKKTLNEALEEYI